MLRAKQLILFQLFCLTYVSGAYAQHQFHAKSGLSVSNFFFKNTKGETDKDLQYLLSNYSALSFDAILGRHTIRPEVGFRQVGASEYISATRVKWDLKYVDVGLGYTINYFKSKRVILALGAGVNLGILVKGEQSIGSEYYNLKKQKALRVFDLGGNGIANAKFKMTEGVYLSLEYRYNISMLNIETDSKNPNQTTRNQSHNLIVGISFDLAKKAKTPAPYTKLEAREFVAIPDTIVKEEKMEPKREEAKAQPKEEPAKDNSVPINPPITFTQAKAIQNETSDENQSAPPKEEVVIIENPKLLLSLSNLVVCAAVDNETSAKNLTNTLKAQGYNSGYLWIPDYEPQGRKLFRIYVGPFKDKDNAMQVLSKVKPKYSGAYYLQIK